MRLCTYSVEPGVPRLGAECGGAILDLARYSHLHDGLRLPADMLGLIDAGPDGWRHATESGIRPPTAPIYFTKPPTTGIGPGEAIPFPQELTTRLDWEVELGVVIGLGGRDIAEARALDYVFGYTVFNDVSARDLQYRTSQWFKGKSLDGSCPMGPVIVTADEVPDPQGLRLQLSVNGVAKQDSTTADMIFSVARIIADLSAGMTLEPGDCISTGTPQGVGDGRKPPEYLKPGDVMEAEVERIGVLRNPVR